MGFFTGLFSRLAKQEEHPENEILDRHGMTRSEIESFVLEELERRRDERRSLELQWQINSNFLYGNQRCDINLKNGTVEQYSEATEGLECEVFNQIEPLYKTRQANLNKVSYAMTVRPRTSELDDVSKAKVSTALLRFKQSVSGFDKFKSKLVGWAEITGTAFILNWWNPEAGEKVGDIAEVVEDEDGNAVEQIKAIHAGDIEYGLLSPFEVFPETLYESEVEDERSIILEQVLSTGEIYDLYGIEVDGKSIETYAIAPVEGAGGYGYVATVSKMTSRTAENAEKVITYYEKPNRRYEKGRMIILIGERLFWYGDLPYSKIPLIAVKSDEVAGQFFGRSFIQTLIPLQRAYNGMMNTIHDYAKRLSMSTPLVEDGSIEDMDDFLDNVFVPGNAIVYKMGRTRPAFMDVPDFPNELNVQLAKIKNDMEYAAGVSQLMVYGQKNGVTSGTAIENLTEIDNTRLSITGENIRAGILKLAELWLEMYKECVSGYRVLHIVGSNEAGDVLIWSGEDINSYDIRFDTENELIYSEEKQNQNFQVAYSMGLFADSDGRIPEYFKAKALEKMKVGDYSSLLGTKELHRQKAERENGLLKFGVIPVLAEIDDHAIHIDAHERLMLQLEYQTMKAERPEICTAFEAHVAEHKAREEAEKQNAAILAAQGENP